MLTDDVVPFIHSFIHSFIEVPFFCLIKGLSSSVPADEVDGVKKELSYVQKVYI